MTDLSSILLEDKIMYVSKMSLAVETVMMVLFCLVCAFFFFFFFPSVSV